MSNSTQNKCPFCNSELISLVLPSNPPQYKTHCPNCENSKVSNSTQNDWAKRFDELFDYRHYDDQNEKWASILDRKDYNPASPEQIKDFIAKELADARREVYLEIEEKVMECKKDITKYQNTTDILNKTITKHERAWINSGFRLALESLDKLHKFVLLATLGEEESHG